MPARLARPSIAWLVHHSPCDADHDAKDACPLPPAGTGPALSLSHRPSIVNRQSSAFSAGVVLVQCPIHSYLGFLLAFEQSSSSSLTLCFGLSVRPLARKASARSSPLALIQYHLTLATEAGTNFVDLDLEAHDSPLVQAASGHWATAQSWDVSCHAFSHTPSGGGAHPSKSRCAGLSVRKRRNVTCQSDIASWPLAWVGGTGLFLSTTDKSDMVKASLASPTFHRPLQSRPIIHQNGSLISRSPRRDSSLHRCRLLRCHVKSPTPCSHVVAIALQILQRQSS